MIIVDGYNLLHSLKPGSLNEDNLDKSREELIRLLFAYSQLQGKRIRVYFDCKSDLYAGTKTITPTVETFYVKDADKAIINDIRIMTANEIVSSDNEIVRVANSNKCPVVTSEQFAAELRKALTADEMISDEKLKGISGGEVAYWMDYFELDDDK